MLKSDYGSIIGKTGRLLLPEVSVLLTDEVAEKERGRKKEKEKEEKDHKRKLHV